MKPLTISASQLNTFSDCERKWWLEKVARIPSLPKGYFTFGTVLHACLERWASADEQGRVPLADDPVCEPLRSQPPGAPVEVFPPGWETADGQTVTPNEAALIRRLVAQAVERGIVQRGDGRVLERELRLPVIEGVDLVGFVDVFIPAQLQEYGGALPPAIHDHKTFGESSVRFLKQPAPASPNYLGADPQLLTYAAAASLMDGWDGPVAVRHNQFPKFEDERGVRSVEASVSVEAWAEHWSRVQAAAARMLQVRDVKRWDDVPGPYGTDACSKYGGCPFRGICGRVETLDGYAGRIEREIGERSGVDRPNLPLTKRRQKNMTVQAGSTNDVFARARAAKAALEQRPATPPPEPEASGGINGGAPPAPAAPAAAINSPPWARPDCPACRGTGFSSRGRPCPICDALSKRAGKATSGMYVVHGDAKEGFAAVAHPEHEAELERLGELLEWCSKDAPRFVPDVAKEEVPHRPTLRYPPEAAAVAKEEPKVQAEVSAEQPAPQPAEPEAPPAKPAKPVKAKPVKAAPEGDGVETRGRKPIGVTVLIGCAQLRGPDRPVVLAQELLGLLGAELAKDMGASSYWELDPFKRRDRIRQRGAEIVESLGRSIVLVPGVRDPDVDSMIGAIIAHADTVIEGVR